MSNPYKGLESFQFWRRAVSSVEHHAIDPVVDPRFKISRLEKVATAGSCFAQHISRRLSSIGFNYFVPESGDELEAAEQKKRGFSMFSARYGNIYTVRQLLQLFEEAFETRRPTEAPWAREDGRYVDPLRPNIEPDGFFDPEAVMSARQQHLRYVREMFLEADVFVFTLGLTEGWANRESGDVFPLAPGVSGGSYEKSNYEFKNFSIDEVMSDLRVFLRHFKSINRSVKVLLTVSPVPLIATFEKRHVLVSTTYSKSVLRVAADMASREFSWVEYFPSYEIITGGFNMGRYYEDDLREVNNSGVSHAMRCFLRNYTESQTSTSTDATLPDSQTDAINFNRRMSDVVCDEESIAKVSF